MNEGFTVVVPVYHEGAHVVPFLRDLLAEVPHDTDVLVVHDSETDPTVPFLRECAADDRRVQPTLNTYGPGPANAIRFGMEAAVTDVVVVMMADGSDEPQLVPQLAQLVASGAVVAAASRYAPGGRQIGGPLVKRLMSRFAGWSLHQFAGVPISDPTSAFKAYSMPFVRSVGVESSAGFEMAIELVAKARRLRLPMAELPTVWRDRTEGRSNFQVVKWLPRYLHWYRFAFGRRLTLAQLGVQAGGSP